MASSEEVPLLTARPATSGDIAEMADLFVSAYTQLRHKVPQLPPAFEDAHAIAHRLRGLVNADGCLVVTDGNVIVGYHGWVTVEGFRGTRQRAAYSMEWANCVAEPYTRPATAVLYRAASGLWTQSECEAHAVTLLANASTARDAWFWNGFGLCIVDAVRKVEPLGTAVPAGFRVLRADCSHADAVHELEAEHCHYYSLSPVLMARRQPRPDETQFLSQEDNSLFLLMGPDGAAGMMRFEALAEASELVRSPQTIAITGAYLRPQHRHQGFGTALLDAGLRRYAGTRFITCSVDFESFNPSAVPFWMRYFTPVAFSLTRHPERCL